MKVNPLQDLSVLKISVDSLKKSDLRHLLGGKTISGASKGTNPSVNSGGSSTEVCCCACKDDSSSSSSTSKD